MKKRIKALLLGGLTMVGPTTFGAVSTSSSFDLGYSNYISQDEPYFGSDYNEGSLATVGLNIRTENRKPGERSKVDIGAMYSFGESETYINPAEAYLDYGGPDEDLSIGRRKYVWSEADEIWNTGLWQPQFRWDRLRPQNQGLFGGFWRGKTSKKNQITAVISPIFIPDTNVTFQEQNGTISSKNPWFRPPPESTDLYGVDTPVESSVVVPETDDVLLNPGVAIRWDRQATSRQRYGLAYAYKPINQILNAFDYRLQTGGSSTRVDLDVYPWVAYHHLVTLDWRYQDRKYGHVATVTFEDPTREFENPDFNYQRLRTSQILSWTTSWNLAGEGPSATQFYGGFMRYWGGSESDGGDTISEGSQFELRPRYVSVGKIGYRYPVWTRVRRLYNSVEANYDFLMKGGTVLTQLEYLMQDSWVVSLNLDLIGVIEEQNGAYKNSFVNTFRANDRVHLGMSYAY